MKASIKTIIIFTLLIISTLFISAFVTTTTPPKSSSVSSVQVDKTQVSLETKLPNIMVKVGGKSIPIKLSELEVNTKIIGTIAITTMNMLFYNDSNRVLSGDLYFPLNEGQTVSRFALEVNGKLRDGVVVEKAKGREVFEKMIRRGIDPGLVELTKGNNFKTRIYPIPAKGYKRVVVTYEQELIYNSGNIYYQLPLYFNEKVDRFKLNIEVEGKDEPTIEKGSLSNFAFAGWKGVYKASFEEEDYIANQELVINIPQAKDAISAIVEKAKNGHHYFYVNINPKLFKKEKKAPSSVCVVWDVSKSASNRAIDKEIEVLGGYLAKLENVKIRLITFSNNIVSNQEFANWSELKGILSKLSYDGATQLGMIPFHKISESEIILVSDVIHTFGEDKINLSTKPVYIINSSAGADYSLQKYISNTTGGQTINLALTTTQLAVKELQQIQYQFISSEIINGELMECYPKMTQKVEGSFSIAGILKSSKGKVKLNFGFGNEIVWSREISIDPENSYRGKGIASRIWAEKKLEDMNVYYEKNKEEITALGKAYSIVTKNTSLIVLDNVADYAENEITPPKELLAAYNNIINDKSLSLKRQQDDKTKMVRKNWQTRVAWWNKKFAVVKAKKAYEWSDTSEDLNEENIVPITEQNTPPPPDAPELLEIVEDDMEIFEMVEEVAAESFMIQADRSGYSNANVSNNLSVLPGVSASSDGEFKTDKHGLVERKKKIKINEWKPDNAIFKELSEENENTCYNKYLELKEENNDQATFYADAARVLRKKGRNEEALRVISNLAELELENHELLKVLANTLMEWKEIDLAVMVYAEILEQREEEPQSYRDLGLALHLQKKDQEAIEMLYQVVEKDWDNRFPKIENIVLGEINSIIANAKTSLNTSFMDNELIDHLPTGLRIVIDWDADNVDIDLWVTDPRKKKCFYSNPKTRIGGLMSKDFTRGYGPEEFILKNPMKGKYKIEVNYYGSSQQRVTGPPTINAKLITNFGMADEKVKDIVLRLKENKEVVYIGELVVE